MLGALPLLIGCAWCQRDSGTPAISAQAKGPNQINLTWAAVSEPGYGYLVEIQSAADSRYASWTELQPIPRAGGIHVRQQHLRSRGKLRRERSGGRSRLQSAERGDRVLGNRRELHRSAGWLAGAVHRVGTEARLRVIASACAVTRGRARLVYGAYSNIVSAKTADYPVRYVSPAGKDSNDGKAADAASRLALPGLRDTEASGADRC